MRDENDRFVIALVSAHKSRFFFSQIGLVEEVYTLDGEELAVTDTVTKDQRQDIKADLRRAQAQKSAPRRDAHLPRRSTRATSSTRPRPTWRPTSRARSTRRRARRLAGTFACEIHASTAEVAAAAEAVQRETEAREEMETLGRVEALLWRPRPSSASRTRWTCSTSSA